VYFTQEHRAGELCESDFTHLGELGITIGGQPFEHMLYHFVLTHSNWETGTLCYSESFAALSEGLQNAVWELGGVPLLHRTDRMTAAINNLTELADFQKGSSGKSVGSLRVSRLGTSEEAVKLAAGGVEGTLLVFPAVVDQGAAVLLDHVADKLFRGALS
jgi:hypothetical protein